MEEFISMIEWTPTLVSFVLAFGVGWLWYSDKMFGKKWRDGIRMNPNHQTTMWPAMISQAVGTFLFAVVIGATAANNDLILAILVTLAIAALIKAGGFFSQKSTYAIAVESGYVVVMAIVMIATHAIL